MVKVLPSPDCEPVELQESLVGLVNTISSEFSAAVIDMPLSVSELTTSSVGQRFLSMA